MGKDADTFAGIVLGILGLALIAKIFEKKCAFCGSSISSGIKNCPHCGRPV